jgi:cupin fold WbuC family metalloprotein
MSVIPPEKWRALNDAVYYTDRPLAGLDGAAISFLVECLPHTPRQRIRVCAHSDEAAVFQEMVIVLGRRGYVRPHRHHGKAESLHVVRGSAALVLFDSEGRTTDHVQLGTEGDSTCWYYRIGEPVYHTLLPLTECFVFHESTTGPFQRSDTEFAPWAPEDSDDTAVVEYLSALTRELSLNEQ